MTDCPPTQTPDDFDIEALRRKYAAERAKRVRSDGSSQYLELKDDFVEFAEVDPHTAVTPRDPIDADIEVVVLGGGIAGLLAGAYLKKAGVADVRIIEMAGDFGGVWYWNRFPGIQCDNDAYCYVPLLEELDFIPSKKFADGAEIFQHCQNIGKHFSLYDGAIFSTQVRTTRWDEGIKRWRLTTNRGDDLRARFVVMAQGSYNRPKLPGIAGINDFMKAGGHVFHSARWDYDYTGGDANGGLTSWRTSAWLWWVPGRLVCSWSRTWDGTPSSSTFFSAPRRRSTSAETSPPIRSGPRRCNRAGRPNASGIFTAGHRSKAWCSTPPIWCATSGPSWAAT